MVKNSPANAGDMGCEDPLEEKMTIHFSILAWEISWTEEPGRLQSTESQRVGPNLAIQQRFGYVFLK